MPEAAVVDLVNLTKTAASALGFLFGRPALANPRFGGSTDVGGADADLIIDRCLIDIKATKKLTLDREMAYQLIGYALLDYNDEFGIETVAFYSARFPALLAWPLHEAIGTMSRGKLTVSAMRAAVRSLLAG